MRIVIDTNVVISGIFFGGRPGDVLNSIFNGKLDAYATTEIVDEYNETKDELLKRGQGHLDVQALDMLTSKLHIIEQVSHTNVCRDPDDNKFLSCAADSKAIYIISGDKDLLTLENFEGIEIITAKEFCERYLTE